MIESGFVLERLVRENIRKLEPYHCAREKVQQGVLLDANENPFPRSVSSVLVNRYPDPYQRALREELARYAGVGPENVLAGTGSDEVLDWIFKVFCQPGRDRVAIVEPTYGMYRVMADIYGVDLFESRLAGTFEFDSSGFLAAVREDVRVLFLCSPNNPTGNLLKRDEILNVLGSWPRIVVVDEAYVEFAAAASLASEVARHPNLIVMRTLSKAFGRAGLRLGYAVACPEIIGYFSKVKTPYNLGALTLDQGVAALRDWDGAREQIRLILEERERLQARLSGLPQVERVFPSRANFLLFHVRDAPEICRRLMADGVIVRDRSSLPGLSDCIRVTVGTPRENDLFLDRLKHHLAGLESGH